MNNRKTASKLIQLLALGLIVAGLPLRLIAATEFQLINDLNSWNEDVVTSALQKLEKEYPKSTNAFPKMRTLLTDKRAPVRRKAARVLGILHADVNDADLKAIVAMLKSTDSQEVLDALKSLRGLKAAQTVPDILPLLESETPNVIRDACRTLAELGTKANIPAIEPLLNHASSAVKADAQDAIFKLKAKS